MLLLSVEHLRERAALERRDIDLRNTIGARRVTHDIDQPINRVQAAEQIIVLAIGTREERREVGEADALEAADALKAFERACVLRADAVDQDLVELAHVVRADHWEGQHVPEREAEI